MSNALSRFFWHSKRRWLYGLLSVITAFTISLGTPQTAQAVSWLELLFRGVQIFQLSNLSAKQEVELGKQIHQQLVNNQINLYRGEQINRYVDRIGQRLAQYSTRPNIPYKFHVVRDDNINAFATMGGQVYVNTGLIKAADNEAQLASVMAHEIGHIAERHAVEQMRQRALAQGVLSAAGLDQSTAVQIGVELALQRPNSREDELEADQRGLDMLRGAGYAPIATVNFLQKLQRGSSVPAFLSTHPATSERIQRLQQQIDTTTPTGEGLNEQAYRQEIRPLL